MQTIYCNIINVYSKTYIILLTFIKTDSDNFSLLIIFIATFFPSTQCTPNFTKPVSLLIINEKIRINKD